MARKPPYVPRTAVVLWAVPRVRRPQGRRYPNTTYQLFLLARLVACSPAMTWTGSDPTAGVRSGSAMATDPCVRGNGPWQSAGVE